MNAFHLLFKTDRFNLSRVGKHFINPCCFGEDLAAWLQGQLLEQGVQASAPGQEDWGWYVRAKNGNDSYLLCMSGNSENETTDFGKWRIIVVKKRSLWKRVSGGGKIAADDAMLNMIEGILAKQLDFQDLHRE